MIRFRPSTNADPPALAALWNRALPDRGVVKPLSAHDFDTLVMGKLYFDRDGLIVAERDGNLVGFVHAGFGAGEPLASSHRLDRSLGTIAMLALHPGEPVPELEQGLVLAAERYLRSRGARVLYAGGAFPVNPFYWGLYGDSEFAGILAGHHSFLHAVQSAGYEPVARFRSLELDLGHPDPRDPKLLLLRRQARVESVDDALTRSWWHSQAIGLFRPTLFRVLSRIDEHELGRAWTWEIAGGFGLGEGEGDGRPRTGLVELEVHPAHRRKGFAQLLVQEIARHSREHMAEVLAVQTDETNHAALALYARLGFTEVDSSTLFRLPASLAGRTD